MSPIVESWSVENPQPNTTAIGQIGPGVTSQARTALRSHAALIVLGALVLVLGVWHLDRYPRTWFDEGSYLAVSESISERGLYASESADGTLDYAPVIGVGPTVLLPAAGVIALEGTDLGAVRLVTVVYLLGASIALYLITRRLFGQLAAVLGAITLLVTPSLDWVATGRQLLGEVPALFFLLIGGVLAYRVRGTGQTLLAGTALGLTMITKGQYTLVLPAAIIAICIVDQLTDRHRPWRWYATILVASCAIYATWVLTLLSIIGSGNLIENMRLLRQSSGGALLVFDLGRMAAAWKLLLGPSSLCLVAPSTIAGLVAWWKSEGQRRWAIMALLIFQSAWLGWFATASIAWPRYAFPGLAISTIFAGYLASSLVEWVWASRTRNPARQWVPVSTALLLLALAMLVAGWRQISPITRADEREPQAFAKVIERTVPPAVVIDSWEPELGFLTDARIQYPPAGSLDTVVRATWLHQGWTDDLEITPRGEYLAVGPFGRWVGAYPDTMLASRYELVTSEGPYSLYKRTVEAGD